MGLGLALNGDKVLQLSKELPEETRDELREEASEDQLVTKNALKTSLDASDTAARSMATAVSMRRTSSLQSSGIPKEVWATIWTPTFYD